MVHHLKTKNAVGNGYIHHYQSWNGKTNCIFAAIITKPNAKTSNEFSNGKMLYDTLIVMLNITVELGMCVNYSW